MLHELSKQAAVGAGCKLFMFCLVGQIDVGEIQHLLHKLGVKVTMEQASRILQRYSVRVCVCVRGDLTNPLHK